MDAVINHMTGAGAGNGSNNSPFDGGTQSYPGVPYSSIDFHGHADCPTSDLNIQVPPVTILMRFFIFAETLYKLRYWT